MTPNPSCFLYEIIFCPVGLSFPQSLRSVCFTSICQRSLAHYPSHCGDSGKASSKPHPLLWQGSSHHLLFPFGLEFLSLVFSRQDIWPWMRESRVDGHQSVIWQWWSCWWGLFSHWMVGGINPPSHSKEQTFRTPFLDSTCVSIWVGPNEGSHRWPIPRR